MTLEQEAAVFMALTTIIAGTQSREHIASCPACQAEPQPDYVLAAIAAANHFEAVMRAGGSIVDALTNDRFDELMVNFSKAINLAKKIRLAEATVAAHSCAGSTSKH